MDSANQGSWESEPRLISEGCIHSLSSHSSGRLVSVILPVKNGAADLRELLPRILSQHCNDSVEIIAVDSGSTDDTVDVLCRFGAKVLAIDPRSFNYGLTRNLAAGYAGGDVFVFVTTRALPAGNQWLANLVAPLDEDPSIAGVYSRCLPRQDVDILTFRGYLALPARRIVREITNWTEYHALTPDELFEFVGFSNVSNAIRPSVLARVPFREAFICEDRLWAKDVLEAGFKIQYEPSSVVLHGHGYSYSELLRRSFDMGIGHRETARVRADVSGILQSIVGPTREDWRYLEHLSELDVADVERWRIAAVLRRAARAVGFWLGTNEDRLPNDSGSLRPLIESVEASPLVGEVRSYVELFRRCYDLGAADRQAAEAQLDPSQVVARISESVRADWGNIHREHRGDLIDLDRALIDAALQRTAEIVGRWLGANEVWLSGDLRERFSLIKGVKAGAVIQEMKPFPASSALGSAVGGTPADVREIAELEVDPNSQADLPALRAVLEGLQAEMLATRAELHTQVEKCNQIIRDLQAEMQMKVEQCNKVIRDLQAELYASHRSRPWLPWRLHRLMRCGLNRFGLSK